MSIKKNVSKVYIEKYVKQSLDLLEKSNAETRKTELMRILNIEKVKPVFEEFSKTTKMAIGIVGVGGEVLLGSGWNDICIKFHRKNSLTLKNCFESDTILTSGLKEGQWKYYQCKNNLCDAVTPLFVSGRHIANVFIGQCILKGEAATEEDIQKLFANQADKYGFDKKAYLEALSLVPCVSKEDLEKHMKFIIGLGQFFTEFILSDIANAIAMKKMESSDSKLRKSENMHKAMTEHISDVITIMGVDGIVKYTSPNIQKIFGWLPKDLVGRSGWKMVHPDEMERLKMAFNKLLKTEGAVVTVEFKFKCKDGIYRPVELTGVNMMKNPEIRGVLLNYCDITERYEAKEVLMESKNMLQRVIDLLPIRIFWKDKDLNFLGCNMVFAKDAGKMSTSEVVGLDDFKMVWKNEAEAYREDDKKVVESGKEKKNYEESQTGPDGKVKWLKTTKVQLSDAEGNVKGILGAYEDITLHKQAEEEQEFLRMQLVQSQKMESIGTLAGGVAHDFNNILTSIIGDTDLLINDKNIDNDNIKKSLASIKDSSLRAGELVKQLLMFGRKQSVNMKTFNINKIIGNMYKMFNRLLGENISIKMDLCGEECHINADKGNIEQVLINLMVNARDAMPKGGNIFIKTKKIIISEENKLQFGNVKLGKYAQLTIEDTGSGMTGEIKDRVFEPFFTTKREGKGTGLGLSVVFGIIKVHKGGIHVYSEPGKGTGFSIYFPVSNKAVAKEKESEKRSLDLQGKGQRILIIEDEEAIQKIAGRILTIKNYKSSIAGSVKEAVEIYKREKGDFDLVFSDMVLPDGTGLDALKELNKIKPLKKILLSSGHLDDKSGWEEINKKEIPFISKPYDMQGLAEKIAEVLKSKG